MKDLPEGWEWAELGELAESEPRSITDGPFGSNLKTSHYTESGPRVIRLQNIGDGRFEDDRAHISEQHFAHLQKHSVEPGDVLIASLGKELPRSCIAPDWLGPAIVKADCIRFRPGPRVDGRFVSHMLNSQPLRRGLSDIIHGVGRPRLNLREIKGIRLPVPPRDEQQRIVEVIEEQFSRLDAGVESLQRAERNLTRLRAEVFSMAVDGTLVDGSQGGAASGRPWVTVEEAAERVVDCEHSTAEFVDRGVACLDTNSMMSDRIRHDRLRFVSEQTYEERIRRMEPTTGDVVFAREGSIGSVVVIPAGLRVCLGQRVMAIRPSARLLSAYLQAALLSQPVRTQYLPKIGGSTSPHLNMRDIKKLGFPMPPLADQYQIVAEIERQFSIIDSMAKAIDAGLQRATSLRQSILCRAFFGRLVRSAGTSPEAAIA